jgi:hypothetical protein
MARDFLLEGRSGRSELMEGQLIGTRRWPFHHRRQTTLVLQDRPVVFRTHLLRRETGKMECAPEAIAATRKMMPLGRGHHAWIDPAENHGKVFGQNIFKSFTHRRSR